ncbi:RraA family protein [Sulfitobacter sp. PR48]|uniref:Putative 4-hydroxy-4-methyl-2-oxoglutarate aldolase n=1 Tax=Sulfitobacter porphyrae TaxID=1246864 RepID=A0ABW2B796_9RHOB|nr:RraA family protein [Sulfitobacter sp. PR48]MDD9721918.1 RraA family protein [Sulfitobacter sp. PR48]GLT11291.1 methyltransferase [Sulfitobacter porphyrae]
MIPDQQPEEREIHTLGRLPHEAFGTFTLPKIASEVLEGFRALPDLTGMTSDAMDELGISGAVTGGKLYPSTPGARLVGRALTVLNVPREDAPEVAVQGGVSMLADVEAHNLAEPGDVLVLQGVDTISNMGGLLASIAKRQGELGAIVDGAVRDIAHSRKIEYPIWSRSVSPVTGKWRVRTIGVNVPVKICGVSVMPGDIVLADEVGVCFVPLERAESVLANAREIARSEAKRQEAIVAGAPIHEVMLRKK